MGLYYYRARYYKPSLGRFLQTDPIKYRGGLNLYTYCGNNSVKFVDPMGLDVWVGKSGAHMNINVGNPKGSHSSYSYGLKGSRFNMLNPFTRTGEVYKDDSGSDGVDGDKYIETTPEQDSQIEAGLDSVVGTEGPYDFWNNDCRTFSNEVFDALKDMLDSIPDVPEDSEDQKNSESSEN